MNIFWTVVSFFLDGILGFSFQSKPFFFFFFGYRLEGFTSEFCYILSKLVVRRKIKPRKILISLLVSRIYYFRNKISEEVKQIRWGEREREREYEDAAAISFKSLVADAGL